MREGETVQNLLIQVTVLLAITTAALGKTQVVGDRMIIEVNNTSYTQRQVELYSLVKQLVTKDDADIILPDESTWEAILDAFEQDVVVELEALRLGSFNPSDASVEKVKDILLQKLKVSKNASAAATKLRVDDKTLARALTSVMRVESFSRNKRKQATLMNSVLADERAPEAAAGEWLKDLKARAVSRYFKSARRYIAISPP